MIDIVSDGELWPHTKWAPGRIRKLWAIVYRKTRGRWISPYV